MRRFYLSIRFLLLFFIIIGQINNQFVMVFIKLTNEMWIISGLEKLINQSSIINIEGTRYITYSDFKNASKMIDQPIHSLIKRDQIISNIEMKRIRKESQLTAEDRKWREELKLKHEIRMMNGPKVKTDAYYFEQRKDETIKDFSKSLSFGMTFLFSFFMAGLTGYYFGIYFIGLSFTHALIVSVIFIMATIVIQTTLFIIKQNRDDLRRKAKSKQQYKEKFQKPFQSQRIPKAGPGAKKSKTQ